MLIQEGKNSLLLSFVFQGHNIAQININITCSICLFFYFSVFIDEIERERERERERDIVFLFYLFMHSLVVSCMCPDQRLNPQPWCIGKML